MRTSVRRKLDVGLIAGGSVVLGASALAGAFFGRPEQVDRMWVVGEVADDGSAQVSEVVDYEFGPSLDKHGIFRVVPGLQADTPITVESDTAPDQIQVTPEGDGVRVRIGDPNQTVSGDHRYTISYPLPGVVRDGRLDWDAVGTEWDVPIAEAEIHVVAPFEIVDLDCFKGGAGSSATCDVRTVEPGHAVVSVDDLATGEGVSLEGTAGAALDTAPALPVAPPPPDDPGAGLALPAAAGTAGALCAGIPAAMLVRRAGRERVAAGGVADAAWASGDGSTDVRVDEAELSRMATIEFAPPETLSPPQGGIVLTEDVRQNHKVAWLIQQAVDGTIDLVEDSGAPTRLRRTQTGDPEAPGPLDWMFGNRTEIELGGYDSQFATGWGALGTELEHWRASSGLWDPRADQARVTGARVGGVVLAVLGAIGAAGGGALASRYGAGWLALTAVGAAVAGLGIALFVRAWELRVRTAAGSAAWLRVESFRRFLAQSEAYHAEEAAKRGVLREYTAWAVALDEIDRWSGAVRASSAIPAEAGLSYVYMVPMLMMSTASTATAPASSGGGGGGFGGGSVGGGAGGGGGGSW